MISEILLETAKPAISALVNDFITPKIKKFADKLEIKYNEILIPRGEHFEEYLHRTYKKYSIINTIALKNEQKLLKDLYLPLTLVKKNEHDGTHEQVKITSFPIDVLKKYNKILITDTAGMGKSTLAKRLFLDVIDNGVGIPIFIELRRLNRDRTILQEIIEQVNSLNKNFDIRLLYEFISIGGFVFFLDGFDEIALNDRNVVTTNIQDFISRTSNNYFILTSRPEQAIASFGDFQKFSINPLNKKEAYELLRKYDKQGNTSKLLIDTLKNGQYSMIDDFLKNPLLVSLLYAAFDHKQTIPLKKHIFYRQVYDAYFDSHDLSKGDSYVHDKKSGLDIDDFDRVLRHIGFLCLKQQKIEFEKSSLLGIIEEAKQFCKDLDFQSSDYLHDLLLTVPLFCKDGHYYKWVHKSLQEYFAAQFIFKDAKKNQEHILKKMYESIHMDEYINIFDIYYDIDNIGFTKNIIYPLLEEYIQFYNDNIFESSVIDKQYVEERIGLLFAQSICVGNIDTSEEFDIMDFTYFKKLKKNIEKVTGLTFSSLMLNMNKRFIATNIKPCRKIINILTSRNKNLFNIISQESHVDSKNNPFDQMKVIDVLSGDNNKELYIEINYLLVTAQNLNYLYLDYQKCCEEVTRINIMIKNSEDSSILLDGI
ncbi:MAG: NACHT domain-containing protein [Bacteroidales bacterium]|nr:NACHT domain-containing protein [Bacteroidales bacterium]